MSIIRVTKYYWGEIMEFRKATVNDVSHIMDILYNNCKQIFVVNNKSLTQFEKENFNHIQKLIFE